MAGEYIFTMRDLRKVVPPSREILKGIYLSFYPGAKIGVLGVERRGQVHAPADHGGRGQGFLGEARPLPGTKIGFLPQEPQLDPRRTSAGTSRRACGNSARCSTSSTRSAPSSPSRWTTSEMNRLLEKQGNAPGADRAARRLGAGPQDRHRHGRAAPAAGRRRRRQALRRREAPGGAVPAAARAARHAAAGRADQPPRRRERGLAGAAPGRVSRHRRRGHPRPLLPRQRGRLDPGARPRARAFPGRATTPPGWSRRERGWRMEEKQARPGRRRWQRELEWIRMSPRGPAGQEQGPHQGLRGAAGEERATERRDAVEIQIPPGTRLGDWSSRPRASQGLWRQAAVRELSTSAAARAASSA